MPPRLRALLPAAIVLSGFAALVYEVVWARQLSVFLGITIRAEAVVLAAFMLGLALGSRVLGRWADRSPRPLRLFASLEAAIGLYGLLSTGLMPLLGPWYARLARPEALTTPAGDVTRFAVAGAALLLPTFLMGGTVPALVRAWLPHRAAALPGAGGGLGRAIGRVYALNTLGAGLGALAAGFVLLPRLGTTATLVAAAALNLAIAAALVAAETRRARVESSGESDFDEGAGEVERPLPRREEPKPSASHTPTALAAFAVFGAAALALQLGWIQALTQILGSSVYAFSLTLSGYLAGLAIGGFGFTAWIRRRSSASPESFARAAPWVAAGAASSVVLGLLAFDQLPGLFLQAFRWNLESRLGWMAVFAFLVVWCLLLVPTLLFGLLSPLVASLCARGRRTAGEDVGNAYAVNALGTSFGALAAGFWLVPGVGLQNTLLLGAIGLAACGALLYLARRPRPAWALGRSGLAVLAFAFAAAATPRWDPVLTTSGVFINASRILDLPPGTDFRTALRERNRVVFYRESAVGSVSVRDVAGDRLLVINGKTDGSRHGDRRTQLALGHLPSLAQRDPEKVLVVGFGTGMTPAAVAAHPEVKRLDVVEISPEVVEASRYFAAENRAVLFDPRLRLHHADARNYLLASRRTWDVIISEPSNPWISGVANLFTREYFELVRRRLEPDGVMAQWFQSYGMASEDLRSIVGTFSEVFEQVTIWSPQPGDLILLGSPRPHALDPRRARRLARLGAGGEDMRAAGWNGLEDFARMLVLDSAAASSFGRDAPANTDRRPRVEFNAPRNMYRETTFANLLELVEHAAPGGRPQVRVVPLRDDRPDRHSALGLTASPFELVPELRVRWLALRAADPTPLPTLAVSLRRILVPITANGDPAGPEIELLPEPDRPDRARLEERARQLAEEAIAGWRDGRLSDGTPTLRAITTAPEAETLVAWVCPTADAGFATYLTNVPAEDVEAFERALSCSEGAVGDGGGG